MVKETLSLGAGAEPTYGHAYNCPPASEVYLVAAPLPAQQLSELQATGAKNASDGNQAARTTFFPVRKTPISASAAEKRKLARPI